MATIKNTSDLLTQTGVTLQNNTTQQISPTDIREAVENVAVSSYNRLTDAPLVGLKEYSTLLSYESGQGCVYSGKIYISNQITVVGAFNAAHWDLYDNLTTSQKAKIDFISVTQAVDLDAIEDAVNNITNPYLNKGLWDASTGVFPGSGAAKNGWTYICSVSGTVDGRDFVANQDKITALVNNASTSTYTSNWFKTDGSDLVTSVNGSTGAVTVTPNATHTGEIDGSEVLTANKTLISNKTSATPVGADYILFGDTSDSDNLKKGLISDIASPDTNIYNTSGTLTAARTVTMAGFGLSFNGGQVSIKGSGATSGTSALLVENSSGFDSLNVFDNGAIGIGLVGVGVKSGYRFEIRNDSNGTSAGIATFRSANSLSEPLDIINSGIGVNMTAIANQALSITSVNSSFQSRTISALNTSSAEVFALTNYGKLGLGVFGSTRLNASFAFNAAWLNVPASAVDYPSIHMEEGVTPSPLSNGYEWLTTTERGFRVNGQTIKLYRETTAVTAAAFVANTSGIVDDTATFGGYTIGQVVAALKAQGLLA